MSTAPRARRDVQPISWELPAAAVAAVLIVAVLVLPAGQAAAGVLSGHGWTWPHGSAALMTSIRGLASGHPGRGLTAAQAARVPAAALVFLLIAASELLLIAAAGYTVMLWWRHLGPGSRLGMADRTETQAVLGTPGLRKARKQIRPDLYGPAPGKGQS